MWSKRSYANRMKPKNSMNATTTTCNATWLSLQQPQIHAVAGRLGFSLQLITLGLGGFLVITGHMTLGNLVAFNSYLWMIDGPVRQSGWLINDWQRFNASCIKIRKLLTSQSHITEKPGVGANANTATPNANNANGVNDATGNASQSQATFITSATQAAQATQVTTNTTRIAGSIDFQHVSFAFPDEPNTPVP